MTDLDLAAIRARSERLLADVGSLPIAHPGVRGLMESAADVPHLLAALEAGRGEPAVLLPAENIALTVARGQVERGENPPFATTAMLVLALDRVTGHADWTEGGLTVKLPPAEGEPGD